MKEERRQEYATERVPVAHPGQDKLLHGTLGKSIDLNLNASFTHTGNAVYDAIILYCLNNRKDHIPFDYFEGF